MSEKPAMCLKFASFVKCKRKEKKITMKKLVVSSGISRAFIYLIETGESSPSIDSATRLLSGIGETWDTFIQFSKEAA